MDTDRPDPDLLLADASAETRGRLKIFLGAAPGVGKTWEMLAAARAAHEAGKDVVIGVVETHGRAGTEAQTRGLPILPRKPIPYRGQVLEEFDLDAALARRPRLILMDELAHANAPGSRHAKRWEDVRDLLEAGIDVWTTLNVQHLESLNDTVARITGVRVTETLPDRVLELADAIELIDLPSAELQGRLREGLIYRPDVARRALDGFFREGNLVALRELALRRAAAHVDDDVREYMLRHGIGGPFPASDRVLALVGAHQEAAAVVRQAKRLADALRAPWVALHVEAQTSRAATTPPLELAAQLGAETEVRAGPDLVRIAVATARRLNATDIVVGRVSRRRWRRLIGVTTAQRLLRHAPDLAVHIVPVADIPAPPPPPAEPGSWLAWAGTAGLVAAVTAAAHLAGDAVPPRALGMVYLALVVIAAGFGPLRVALFAAALGFLAWDFFFLPPLYRLTIGSADDLTALAVFALVAVVSGGMAGRIRAEARSGQARIEGLRRIAAFSRRLGEPPSEPELLAEVARQASDILGEAVVLMRDGDELVQRAAASSARASVAGEGTRVALDEASWAAARWCAAHDEPTGRGSATLPSASWRFTPMRTVRERLGVIGARGPDGAAMGAPTAQTLSALADQAATAVERVRLATETARGAAMAETQKLRTALLASLGHDLRTPLTGIRGAAETLALNWETMDPARRGDLLASIGEDTARMTRFLANITELTRLESGAIQPRLAATPLPELIEAALVRVPDLYAVAVNLPPDLPRALVDPALLEQVFVNVLDNAHRYTPEGSLVRVSGHAAAGRVAIEIADEGVGIPPADLPHVFDSFFRARRGDRVSASGTGLGLAIARGLLEAMGGTVEAVSPRPDAPRDGSPGTLVVIRVPAAP